MRTHIKDRLKVFMDAELKEVESKRKYLLDTSNKSNRDEYYFNLINRAEAEMLFYREVVLYDAL